MYIVYEIEEQIIHNQLLCKIPNTVKVVVSVYYSESLLEYVPEDKACPNMIKGKSALFRATY